MEKFIHLPPDREHFSVREVARALGVHVSTIWRFFLKGVRGQRLRSFKIGARRRVLRADLVAWLADINNDRHDSNQVRQRNRRADRTREAQLAEQRLVAEGF